MRFNATCLGRTTLLSVLFAGLAIGALTAQPSLSEGLTPYDIAKLSSVGDAAVAPDGAWIAYTRSVPRKPFEDEDGSAWTELYVADAHGKARPFVTGKVNVQDVSWRPGSSTIAFLAKRDGDETRSLYVISTDGGEARRLLTHDTDITDYSFSPNGEQVAFLATRKKPKEKKELQEKGFDQEVYEEELESVSVWMATPGEEAERPKALDLEGSASALRWSPAGDRLAVALAPTPLIDDALMSRRVRIVDVATGAVTTEVGNPGKLGKVAWSPDGQHLAFLSGADLHDPSAGRLMVVATGKTAVQDLLPSFQGDVADFVWKSPGSLYAIVHQGVETRLVEIELEGGAQKILAADGPAWESVSTSGDGTVVALVGDTPAHPSELFRWTADGPQRVTDSNPWLADKQLGRQEVVRYPARDGLELEGLVVHPIGEEAGRRYPLILVVHGGPEAHYSNGWLTTYSSPGQMAAARGFMVFYPNYRGSTGRGVEFAASSQGDPAGKEFDDLVDGVDYLIGLGWVDKDRVGITGGSYGGYATAWGSTYYSERFAAGVMFVGISEKLAKWGASDIPKELNLVHDRHWPWEAWDLLLQRSPVYHVEKARTPLLILHGKNDPRVHPSQSLILYRYLKVYGKVPVRLVWYPDEGHGNRKAAHRLDYSLRALRWLEHYLQGPGGEKPPVDLEYERPKKDEESNGES